MCYNRELPESLNPNPPKRQLTFKPHLACSIVSPEFPGLASHVCASVPESPNTFLQGLGEGLPYNGT